MPRQPPQRSHLGHQKKTKKNNLLPLPQVLLLNKMLYGTEDPLGQFSSAVPVDLLPATCPVLAYPLQSRAQWEKKTALTLGKH